MFRFLKIVLAVLSASFQFQFWHSARAMLNVQRVQVHSTTDVFWGFHSVSKGCRETFSFVILVILAHSSFVRQILVVFFLFLQIWWIMLFFLPSTKYWSPSSGGLAELMPPAAWFRLAWFQSLASHQQESLDIVGGVHVGRDNLDVGTGDFETVFRWAAVETEEAMPPIFHSLDRFFPTSTRRATSGGEH